MSAQFAALLGISSETIGLCLGVLVVYLLEIKNAKLMGSLYGGTSGLMIAMICFDILPMALNGGRESLVFGGIIIGVLLGIILDEYIPLVEAHIRSTYHFALGKTGLILAVGIAIHNIPEGFAIGTMCHTSLDRIGTFLLILTLHSIPEGIAFSIPFKKVKSPIAITLLISFILGAIMGLGSYIGYILSGMSPHLITIGLGVASGIILYIVCGEIMPESRKIWNGRWTTIANIIGLMLGILLLSH